MVEKLEKTTMTIMIKFLEALKMYHGNHKKHNDKKDKKMAGGRMQYGKGGYASISDMEKKCASKAGYQESGQRK